ncbi:MAG: response regulator [Chloroflexaceae bacterium]|nr:response regulator [Chloroflexaceae bacterium]
MHGGTISVTSGGKGLGATFTLLLPSSAPDVPLTASSDSAAPENSLPSLVGVEVLLVEDDPDTRELTTFLLEQAGARAIAVAGAADALNCLAQCSPNILVCDIAMPQMDGYQLLQRVRAQPQYQKLPAIALTACAGPKDAQYAIQAGFNQHLGKPVPPQRLLGAIEQLMRSQPEWRSPLKRGL